MTVLPEEARDARKAERAAYAMVDDALRSFPMRPTPPGLAPDVLAALRSPGAALASRPAFRLSWIDFALSGFAAMMLALLLLLSGWLTPEAAARLQAMAAGPLFQTGALAWTLAAAGLVITAGLLLVAGVVFQRTAPL
jgi:hypothetical protein